VACSARTRRLRHELQGHAVHAITKPRRLGTVIEYVAEMSAAAPARNRRSHHAEAAVLGLVDRFVERCPKARPAGAAVEFGLGREQRQVAAGAGERAGAVFFEKRTRERPFGAFMPEYLISVRGQKLAPFVVGVRDFVG